MSQVDMLLAGLLWSGKIEITKPKKLSANWAKEFLNE